MRGFMLALTGVCTALGAARMAHAQTFAPASPDSLASAQLGATEGRRLAEEKGTGKWLGWGLLGGMTLGPIGLGVVYGYASSRETALPPAQRSALASMPPAYSEAFARAYRGRAARNKKRSALVGGLIGTVVLVLGLYLEPMTMTGGA